MRRLVLAVLLTVGVLPLVSAAVIVDFSPDTTGNAFYYEASDQYGSQIVGQRFTLAADATITGGATFANYYRAIGTLARFMIFTDNGFGVPTLLYNFGTKVDAVDQNLTSLLGAGFYRRHVSVAPFALAAGTYWFALPGDGVQMAQATMKQFTTGAARFGPTGLDNLSGSGDMYFTLDGTFSSSSVPEPATFALVALGLVGLTRRRRSIS